MELDERLKRQARELGADCYGVADLAPAREQVLLQGGEQAASYPLAVSIGIGLVDEIVDRLTLRFEERAACVNYLRHCYDVVNGWLDLVAARLARTIQAAGYRALPLPASVRLDNELIWAQFSHKLAAHHAGLGWIGKSCLLVTPENGPRVRWNTVLTDAPLAPTGQAIEQRCGRCNECVDICPVQAFTGREYVPGEPREARYDAARCERYFEEMKEQYGERMPCGLCVYVCPHGRH